MKLPFPPRRVLRLHAVEDKVGLRRSQIFEKIATGEFPKPIKLSSSGRAIGWIEAELEQYLDARIAERDATQ
jgi:prophage regulatory protein